MAKVGNWMLVNSLEEIKHMERGEGYRGHDAFGRYDVMHGDDCPAAYPALVRVVTGGEDRDSRQVYFRYVVELAEARALLADGAARNATSDQPTETADSKAD